MQLANVKVFSVISIWFKLLLVLRCPAINFYIFVMKLIFTTFVVTKAGFPLDEFVRAHREKSNLIGWRQTLTPSPPNHIRFLLVRAKKIAKWKTGF